jgi:AcrR family transcriptional regulator
VARDPARRAALAEAATDFALEHGLIGLSLRPLAAAIGTSDRMLLYHFADKDDLVATVLRVSTDRSVEEIRALPPTGDVRSFVQGFWDASITGQLARCQRLYVEAAALGLLGQEPYASVVREANDRWTAALTDRVVEAGCPPETARRVVVILDAAFMGLQLDLPLDRGHPDQRRAVSDVADALAALAEGGNGASHRPRAGSGDPAGE